MDRNPDSTHLEVHFNLICFQVLLTPHIATQRLRKIHNWYTSGAFLLVLSYKEEILSILYRFHWIWTELSHACDSIIFIIAWTISSSFLRPAVLIPKARSWRIILPLTKENIFFVVLNARSALLRQVNKIDTPICRKKVSTGASFHSINPKSLKRFSTSFAHIVRSLESFRAAT
jgi:hypothetical protein